MYKDKAKQQEANREAMRRLRKKGITEGITDPAGITPCPTSGGITKKQGITEGMTPDILLKLTDPFWRDRLTKICTAFKESHHPEYVQDMWLGVSESEFVHGSLNLSVVCDLLECTG